MASHDLYVRRGVCHQQGLILALMSHKDYRERLQAVITSHAEMKAAIDAMDANKQRMQRLILGISSGIVEVLMFSL